MFYKVYGDLHIWGWVDFRREIDGLIVDFDTSGNIINYIIYEVKEPIDKTVLEEYGLNAGLISDINIINKKRRNSSF